MKLNATYHYHPLKFILPGGTSRGILNEKPTWIIKIINEERIFGYGEVSIIEGLSIEKKTDIVKQLEFVIANFHLKKDELIELNKSFPAIVFALEQAFLDLENKGNRKLFQSSFSNGDSGISINGLIWMNPIDTMKKDIVNKIGSGYKCIKLKIGALNFTEELNLLKWIRLEYGNIIEIRVDANGAFNHSNVFQMMDELQKLNIHSIEQPIQPMQFELMRKVCRHNNVGVALDEELIGVNENNRIELIEAIKPNYLILKPSLLGGIKSCNHWIELAEKNEIGWWATSALESNIGLNAIAQWVSTFELKLPQGLGTGSLFSNNFDSPLKIDSDKLFYDKNLKWNIPY